jgi:hypothetical protein
MIDLEEQAGSAMNVQGQFSDARVSDPQVTLGALAFANELGRLLWRMKYGQDFRLRDSEGRTTMRRATLLLANCIRDGVRFNRVKFTGLDQSSRRDRNAGKKYERVLSDVLERFAHRVIIEWVDDRCPRCDGRGVIGRAPTARIERVKCGACAGSRFICVDEHRIPFAARSDGLGPLVFREMERCKECNGCGHVAATETTKRTGRQICPDCQGNSGRTADHIARAYAIGVRVHQYHAHWLRQFDIVHALLDAIDADTRDTVRRLVKR